MVRHYRIKKATSATAENSVVTLYASVNLLIVFGFKLVNKVKYNYLSNIKSFIS